MTWHELAVVEWGSGADQLRPNLVAAPSFSLGLAPPEQVPAIPRLRRGPAGSFFVVNLDNRDINDKIWPDLVQFSAAGKIMSKRRAVPAEARRLFDFVVDSTGNVISLLTENKDGSLATLLRAETPDGDLRWQLYVNVAAGCLLLDGQERLYSIDAAATVMMAIAKDSGLLETKFRQPAGFSKAQIAPDGTVISVVYDAASRQRGQAFFHPVTGSAELIMGDREVFGWLLYPFGVNAQNTVYAYQPGQDEEPPVIGTIAGAALTGQWVLTGAPWRQNPDLRPAHFSEWRVDPDGDVLIPAASTRAFHIFKYTPAG